MAAGSRPQPPDLASRLSGLPLLALPYPLNVARTLIQIGYEPLPPRTVHWLGREYYAWPSAVAYVKYIYGCEGVWGMYRGFSAKAVETLLYGQVKDSLYISLAAAAGVTEPLDKAQFFTRRHAETLAKELAVEITANCTAAAVAFPLSMVNVRMIAQFVGKEDVYSNFIRGLYVLARDTNGDDYVDALIPTLIREALLAAFWVAARHLVAYFNPYDREEARMRRERRRQAAAARARVRQAVTNAIRVDADGYVSRGVDAYAGVDSDDSDMEDDLDDLLGSPQGEVLMQNVVHMVPAPYTYPLLHASTRLCLKGSGLLAASSPSIASCGGWYDCLRSLYGGGPQLAYMGSRLLNARRIPNSLLPSLQLS